MARAIGVLATAALITACSGGGGDDRDASRAESPPPTTTPALATTTSTVTAPPSFDGRVEGAPDAARLHASWRPGCPVSLEQLRLLSLDYWGYDGVEHHGELVVNAEHADAIVGVFGALFEMRFPIERIELVDAYGGDDDAVMAANATSGFNCREVVGRPGVWSQHAYGLAIDVNPLTNPYVISPEDVRPPEGRAYLDRAVDAPGLIRAGDAVVQAFASIGWEWGGTWSMPDYQHFSAAGN